MVLWFSLGKISQILLLSFSEDKGSKSESIYTEHVTFLTNYFHFYKFHTLISKDYVCFTVKPGLKEKRTFDITHCSWYLCWKTILNPWFLWYSWITIITTGFIVSNPSRGFLLQDLRSPLSGRSLLPRVWVSCRVFRICMYSTFTLPRWFFTFCFVFWRHSTLSRC